jgi:hypothetical protein
VRPRLILLAGQTIALGLTMAFLVVPASSIFLGIYGAAALPYTYLCVAVAGTAVSALMARAQRRWSLARVTAIVLVAYIVLVSAAWGALTLRGAMWVTFPLVVLFPLSIPVGFVLIGSQAGRLLDVRQMKAYFPRVVAGFSVGFAIGGIAAARLVSLMGGPENLLGVDVCAAVALLVLSIVTARRYPGQLASPPPPRQAGGDSARHDRPDIRSLLRNRLVVMIFGYQLLSAAVTQLLDFMVWERAADRYPDPSDLARFLGLFGAVINIVSVAFVALLAGRLLTRYGIRFGLAANPAGVLALLVVSAVAGYAGGPASTIFFLLVCAQQVTDIALTDGTTRTSVNATYQALPPSQRVAAQTWVEGVGFPLALGFVGVLLIVGNAIDLGIVTLVVITAALTVIWLLFGFAAFTKYGVSLRRTLTRREWDPVALRLDDQSRDAVERLVSGDDIHGLRLGLDLMADTDDPGLAQRVRMTVADPDPARRLAAVAAATRAMRTSLDSSWVAIALAPLTSDPDESVRTAVEIALAMSGTEAERAAARRRWAEALTGDEDGRRQTAVVAAGTHADPVYAPGLLALVESGSSIDGLADALAANAAALAPAVDEMLGAEAHGCPTPLRRLVGALGESGSAPSRAVLLAHLGHGDPETADVVLGALAAGDPVTDDQRPVVRAALTDEARRLGRVLASIDALADSPFADHVLRNLHDEAARARRRATELLGLLHDPMSLARNVRLLGDVDGARPLALETLEVTVGRSTFPLALALLDPTLADHARREQLGALVAARARFSPIESLHEMVDDPDDAWRDPWLRACALHALARLDPPFARERAAALTHAPDPVVVETAAWVVRAT